MAEIRQITTGETLKYTGPFRAKGLKKQIDEWIDRFEYDMDELISEERVTPTGKTLKVVIEGNKSVSDYADLNLRFTVSMENMEEIIVEQEDGTQIQANDGDVNIMIDSWVTTDTQGKYEGRPILFFLRFIAEKFFFKSYIEDYTRILGNHRKNFKREINRYLNKELQ